MYVASLLMSAAVVSTRTGEVSYSYHTILKCSVKNT